MNTALAAAVALAASQGYSIEMPYYSQSFVLPFRNRKRFKQTPMPSRSYFPDIEDLKVGDVVRFRMFERVMPYFGFGCGRRVGVVTETAFTTEEGGARAVKVDGDIRDMTIFQDEVLEVIKNPRTQA
jgi:hypothetical protein